MSKLRFLLYLAIGPSATTLLLTIGDALALHDIGADYVSPTIVDSYKLDPASTLPDWTSTPGEWMMVNLSFYGRFSLTILNLIILAVCLHLVAGPPTTTEDST